MTSIHRPRRLARAALTAALMLGLAACDATFPNTTFEPNSEFGRDIDRLWSLMLVLGTIVFVGVEVGLIYVLMRFRRREGAPEPKHVHGNTTLEITWTVIPAVVLIFIAIPTVRTIFRTQAEAAPGALQVEVIGHQWWWEFRYPDLGIVTANELYLPVGQTVNFALKSADVIHSFWIPQLGGKRDLITTTRTTSGSRRTRRSSRRRGTGSVPSTAARRTPTCASACIPYSLTNSSGGWCTSSRPPSSAR